MAGHLISEGFDLTVWNRTIDKAKGLNAAVVASPADLFSKTDMVILNLTDSNAVRNIIEGHNGLLGKGAKKGKSFSTPLPTTSTLSWNSAKNWPPAASPIWRLRSSEVSFPLRREI